MQRVNFYYDYKKDAWSWVFIVKHKSSFWGLDKKKQMTFIPADLIKRISKKNDKSAEKLVLNYLKNHPKKVIRQAAIKEELTALQKSWEKVENKYFSRLAKITQKPKIFPEFKCYITTGFMCPYNEKENWFMVSFWHSIPQSITTIAHEIFHLHFLHYYKKYCRKSLSQEQTEDLKEAITFILNTDFNDLILKDDPGYPAHQKLRKKLEKIWKQNKNFNEFLDKAINVVKNSS
jgi:hypothetical protein